MLSHFARSLGRFATKASQGSTRSMVNNTVVPRATFSSLDAIRDQLSKELSDGHKFSDAEWQDRMDKLSSAMKDEVSGQGLDNDEIDAMIGLEKATFTVVRDRKLHVSEELASLDDGSQGDRWIDDLDTWDNPVQKTVFQAAVPTWDEAKDGREVGGLAREEAEALKYDYDIFTDGVFSPNWGTLENPRMVRSAYGARIVGCTGGGPDPEHEVRWINMTDVDTKYECDLCSQVFQIAPVEYVIPEHH
eukprot:TRINITY_DN10947_c0_g1_i1.p2 TRINITY_DN10947_c0_g1~~TRINITY_DN10947_c0_g1_i1.p2  ORF type:complete len:247 (+),score=65.40 TRINITY_DN10947_c0_g1_i1:267-1007(+)